MRCRIYYYDIPYQTSSFIYAWTDMSKRALTPNSPGTIQSPDCSVYTYAEQLLWDAI